MSGFRFPFPFTYLGGLFSEIVLHIFPVTVLIYVFSNKAMKNSYQKQVFWLAAATVSIFGAVSMYMAFHNPTIPLNQISNISMLILMLLIFVQEMVILYIFRLYGFISPIVMRLSFYMLWHVFWPLVFYI